MKYSGLNAIYVVKSKNANKCAHTKYAKNNKLHPKKLSEVHA